MSRPLTAVRIDSLKPGEELSDASSGLRVRVSPSGYASFRWAVKQVGKVRWVTLGRWSMQPAPGYLTLAEARTWLERLKLANKAGRLGEAEKELAAHLATLPIVEGETVRAVAAAFVTLSDRKRPERISGPLDKDILPAIGNKSIRAVTHQDIRAIVSGVVERGATTHAGSVLGVMKQLFRFAVQRGDLDHSPAERFTNPSALGVVNRVCDRFLSDEEIAAWWRALDAYRGMSPIVRSGLRILLLTGVRTGELLKARLGNVDLDARTWTIPTKDQKLSKKLERNARPFVVPLSPTAVKLFSETMALSRAFKSPYVLASPYGATQGEALTDKTLNRAMRRLFEGDDPFLKFEGERPTAHDLRRTLRTGLGNLGVPFHVAERCLNHSLGRIAATYDLSDYLDERRDALEKWDRHIEKLIS